MCWWQGGVPEPHSPSPPHRSPPTSNLLPSPSLLPLSVYPTLDVPQDGLPSTTSLTSHECKPPCPQVSRKKMMLEHLVVRKMSYAGGGGPGGGGGGGELKQSELDDILRYGAQVRVRGRLAVASVWLLPCLAAAF